ncbi:MAG: hypothetical protein IVW57_02415 [Ktedonobacterales bacterium]|nr:hypothetical protein [Ktedonobacterales bacterium]
MADISVTIERARVGRSAGRLPRPMEWALRVLAGGMVVVASTWLAALHAHGWQPLGPLLGITLVVASLFGDLPPKLAWTQRLGDWLFPGILVGTLALLLPLAPPSGARESSFFAFSPAVWAAYISIVLVGISFEESALPRHIYRFCRGLRVEPWLVVPLYVVVAGLLGNILDGVSIMAISVVILLSLLPRAWAIRAAFALLFGGLISNLVTVAAEPTNIKFQDVLRSQLDRVSPSYWFTNWPISIFGILLPAAWLALTMRREHLSWRAWEADTGRADAGRSNASAILRPPRARVAKATWMSLAAPGLLAGGILLHSLLLALGQRSRGVALDLPLWLLLLPAGLVAVWHLNVIGSGRATRRRLWQDAPVWLKLMVIFSLLWFLGNALTGPVNVFAAFFTLPPTPRYGVMVVLSLFSSVTDNVALAAMQGSLLLAHPLAIWQVRLLFLLLTWSGGFTPFGCLQSLAVNGRLGLSTGAWLRQTWVWGMLALLGGLLGLALILAFYPSTTGLP